MNEICYGKLLWFAGVHASNVSQERKLLWRSLIAMIDNGLPGLLKGDFNVCYEPNQLTFIHFIMDGLEAQEREILRLELCYRMYRNKLRDKCKHTFNQPNIRILEEIMKKCMEYYTQL